jgi:replicative DNA helicase
MNIKEHIINFFNKLDNDNIPKISSGFTHLDMINGGFKEGEITTIIGETGIGKTSLALNIAMNMSFYQNLSIVYVSAEINDSSLINKIISSTSKINHMKLSTMDIDNQQWVDIAQSIQNFSEKDFYIIGNIKINSSDIEEKIKNINKIDCIFIDGSDYIDFKDNNLNREEQIAKFYCNMKYLAKTLKCPVIITASTNLQVNKRGYKRPILSDINYSCIINLSDNVIGLYREWYFNPEYTEGKAELISLKSRTSYLGVCIIQDNLHKYGLFENIKDVQE